MKKRYESSVELGKVDVVSVSSVDKGREVSLCGLVTVEGREGGREGGGLWVEARQGKGGYTVKGD